MLPCRAAVVAFCAIFLTACAKDLPPANETISNRAQAAAFPELLPLGAFVTPDIQNDDEIRQATAETLARLVILRRKAAALRGRDIYAGAEALKQLR